MIINLWKGNILVENKFNGLKLWKMCYFINNYWQMLKSPISKMLTI